MESVSLIDVSSEDDLLISSDPPPEGALSGQEGEIPLKMSKLIEHVPEQSESPEQKRVKSGKYNLRKSLAWDSAFFTSEGVLNPEELAIVNSTFRMTGLCPLPDIQEEIRKSTESSSTLDSESWALENLEVDLFENLRASIQKSLGSCDKTSTLVHPSKTMKQPQPDAPRLGFNSSKNAGLSSQNKMKPPIALKRDGVSKQLLECTSKGAVTRMKLATKGNGEPKATLKPPRIVPKTTSSAPSVTSVAGCAVPVNKSSSGRIQMKINSRNALSGSGANRQPIVTFSKTSGESSSTTRRSIPSPKFTAGSCKGNAVFSSASSLNSSSPSSSSESAGKSSLEPPRKRTASRNSEHSPSATTVKTPVRTSQSTFDSTNAPRPPTFPSSRLKFAARVSPTSSIDSVVSESSSSTSSIKPSKSTESLGASSSSSVLSLTVSSDLDQPCPRSSDPVEHRIMTQSSVPRDRIRSTNGNPRAKCLKPSGLRMPTPKIGYFDAEKTLCNSNKVSQTGPGNCLVKNTGRNDPVVASKLLKPSKLHVIRPAAQSPSVNFVSSRPQPTDVSSQGLRLAPPIAQHQSPTRRNLSPVSSCSMKSKEVVGMVECGSLLNSSEEQASMYDVTCKSTEAALQVGTGEKHEQSSCTLYNEHCRGESGLHSIIENTEKENLFSPYEANGISRHLHVGSENKSTEDLKEKKIIGSGNLSFVERMEAKISSLSLSDPEMSLTGN